MSTRTAPVRLSLGSEIPTSALVTIDDWSAFDRVKRAAVGLSLCWLLAGMTVVIPALHFVLVPGLLAAGPVVFVLRVLQRSTFKQVVGDCPRCKASRTMPMSGRVKAETNVFCDGCGNQLTCRLEVTGSA